MEAIALVGRSEHGIEVVAEMGMVLEGRDGEEPSAQRLQSDSFCNVLAVEIPVVSRRIARTRVLDGEGVMVFCFFAAPDHAVCANELS